MSVVVAEARLWIGTPYLHQASVRGAGCDCLGLVRGVWRHIHGQEPELVPPYTADWDEVAQKEVLLEGLARVSKVTSVLEPGTVLLFRMRQGAIAKHLGICSSVGSHSRFIHSYCGHGVVETSLSDPWRKRIVGLFSIS